MQRLIKRPLYTGLLALVALMASAAPAAARSQWFDSTTGQLLATGWPVTDVNTDGWAQAGRAAQGFCEARGFVGGFLNGHQAGNLRGVICLRR